MKALPLSEQIALLKPDTAVNLITERKTICCTIKSLRRLNRYFLLSFHEIIDREEASQYRGALLSAITDPVAPGEGEFLLEQVIGLNAVTTDGEDIGSVAEILETAGHDVYVVRKDDREYLIPAVKEFIQEIQLDSRRIIIKKMKGLLD